VAYSPDGKTLAWASHNILSRNSTVRLWDIGSGTMLRTFRIDAVIETLSFSDNGTSLQIHRGSLPILSSPLFNGTAANSLQLPPSIFVQGQWVYLHTKPILWLPPEHRSDCITVHNGIVAFGYASGRVAIMEFAL
jgi:WD40 repeat protein